MTRFALIAAGLALAGPACAQDAAGDNDPWLWAAPALYGFEDGACEPGRSSTMTMVDPLFCPQLDMAHRQVLGAAFARAVASRFARVEPSFGSHLPADALPAARLRSVLVASLRLTRATYATVPKPGSVDAYLPVTLTLDITNPATGEVVFTRTRTLVAQGVFSAQTLDQQLGAQFASHLTATMEALVSDAGAAFLPYAQTAKVLGSVSLGKDDTGYVVDKGRNAGLRTGDGIGDGQVAYSGPDYAVVRSALAPYREGQQLSRLAANPVEMLSRPSVLTVVEQAPEGYAPAWLGQILEDALGSGTALAPVPVNPAFSGLRTLALDGAGSDLAPDARALPDYVASAKVILFDPVRRPSDIPGVTVERHAALAMVTLVDASGRAVGTWQGNGLIEDKISGDMRMPLSQRRDAVLRNALEDAARKMGAFRPQPRFARIARKDGTLMVEDAGGAVGLGQTLPVLRPAGRFAGIAGSVMVPVGEVSTREIFAGGVLVSDGGVAALALRGGEAVALETAGVPATMRLSVGQCLGADGLPAIEDRGQVAMPGYGAAAASLLASGMAAPVRLTTLPAHLVNQGRSFATWSKFRVGQPAAIDACFVPVIAVVPAAATYQVTVGYTLHSGSLASGTKIGSSGLATRLTPTRLQPGSNPAASAAMLQADLVAQILPMAAKAAAELKPAD